MFTTGQMLANTHTKGANYGCLRNYHGHCNYPSNGRQDIENVDTDIPAERKLAKSLRRVIVSSFIGILGLVCVWWEGGGGGERGREGEAERGRERGGEGERGRRGGGERGEGKGEERKRDRRRYMVLESTHC